MTARAKWKEFRAELGRVSWPSRPITLKATWGVLWLLLIVIIFLGVLDFLFNLAMRALTG